MNHLTQLSEQDIEKMAQEIMEITESKSEDELFELIGNALHDSGLTVSTSESFSVIEPKMYDQHVENFNFVKSLAYVADTQPLSPHDAKQEGKKFWQRFKDKVRNIICNDPEIRKLLEGDGTLKEYLKVLIPLILTALGLAALNPILLAIVVAIIALIIKIGIKAYCELN